MEPAVIVCLCPACSNRYRLAAKFAGRAVRCPGCGERFAVPQPHREAVRVAAAPPDPEAGGLTYELARDAAPARHGLRAVDHAGERQAGAIPLVRGQSRPIAPFAPTPSRSPHAAAIVAAGL